MAQTHELFQRLNNLLIGANFPLSSISRPDYIAEQKARDPNYVPAPYDRISLGTQYHGPEDDKLEGHCIEQWWASFDSRESYGIFNIKVTRFAGPSFNGEHGEIVRLDLKLVEGEDALDNDEFNDFGWQRQLLWIELPLHDDLRWEDTLFSHLAAFLMAFNSSTYFPAAE